jgi:type VI secretion system secreted protein Hcp
MAEGGPKTILTIDGLTSAGPAPGGIEVLSWTWAQSMSGTMALGAGAGAGRVEMSDLSLQVRLDSATPRLYLACAAGKHHPRGELRREDAGETLRIEMEDVLITQFQIGGSEAYPGVQVGLCLSFRTLRISLDRPGVEPVSAGWDQAKGAEAKSAGL